jgi:hypothetical protein
MEMEIDILYLVGMLHYLEPSTVETALDGAATWRMEYRWCKTVIRHSGQ